MKKIFTLLVLFATALTASAQLSFTMDGNTIENGATITSSKLDLTFEAMGFVMFKPDVFVSSEKADTVTVEVKALDGRSVSLCLGNNITKLTVVVRVWSALLYSHSNLTSNDSKNLTPLGIIFLFLMFDVCKF